MKYSIVLWLVLAVVVSGQVGADARSDYMIHCMGCHQMDGSGMEPDVPSFLDHLDRILTTNRGREYLVRVPGAAQSPISNHQLAEVLNYITLNYADRSAEYAPFTEIEVAHFRRDVLVDPAAMRAQLFADH